MTMHGYKYQKPVCFKFQHSCEEYQTITKTVYPQEKFLIKCVYAMVIYTENRYVLNFKSHVMNGRP